MYACDIEGLNAQRRGVEKVQVVGAEGSMVVMICRGVPLSFDSHNQPPPIRTALIFPHERPDHYQQLVSAILRL